MARYGTTYKGYSPYSTPRADGWSEPGSYPSDHVCKPVIIDAEGRKRPIIAITSSQSPEQPPYNRAETAYHQQHVHSPIPSENRHGHPTQEPAMVEHYRVQQRLQQTSDPIYDRLQKVEEIITKVQNEVSVPKVGPFNAAAQQRHSPKPPGSVDGYYGDKEWQRSNGYPHQSDKYEDYYRKPAVSSTWGTTQPDSKLAGATNNISTAVGYLKEAVSQPDSKHYGATNNMSTAIGYLKEAVKPSSITTPPPYTQTYPPPKRGGAPNDASGHYGVTAPRYNEPAGYAKTMHSNDGATRYGNFRFSPRPIATQGHYGTTI